MDFPTSMQYIAANNIEEASRQCHIDYELRKRNKLEEKGNKFGETHLLLVTFLTKKAIQGNS